MPFGMFVGVNNHFQSTILAGVLMTNETTEIFKWVFREFVSLMGGNAPATILTGDDSFSCGLKVCYLFHMDEAIANDFFLCCFIIL
jgi:hypothetical protein